MAQVRVAGEQDILRLCVLGRFQAERVGGGNAIPIVWSRPAGKALVKLLAVERSHCMHEEQILDALWPDETPAVALSRFRRALYLARHALEPDLSPRRPSTFLHSGDELLALACGRVWVDADHFEALAGQALHVVPEQRTLSQLQSALNAYSGELLPEDRYTDWSAARREALAELRLQVLLALADVLEQRGSHAAAIERLRDALSQDGAVEAVHRRLMQLYVLVGNRHAALRQYQQCREVVRRELDTEPEPETIALYEDILAGRIAPDTASIREPNARTLSPAEPHPLPPTVPVYRQLPFVGRERMVQVMLEGAAVPMELPYERIRPDGEGLILISGEPGVGKTRLIAEVAQAAHRHGAVVLWGASHEREGHTPYGPFVEAVEVFLRTCDPVERECLGTALPELMRLIPGTARDGGNERDVPHEPRPWARAQLFADFVHLLETVGARADAHVPALLVLDDLHAADPASLQLLHHLVRRGADHRALIVGTYREEAVVPGSAFGELLATLSADGLCRAVELLRLSRSDCDRMVRSLLAPGDPAPQLLDHMYGITLGNPLFTLLLVRALQESNQLVRVEDRWQLAPGRLNDVPRRVGELVLARVDRLGEDVRRVLSLAAAAGMECPFAVLRAAASRAFEPPLSEVRVLEALDRVLAVRMLVERMSSRGVCYAFRHPLPRTALYERLSQPRRAQLHGILAEVIEEHSSQDVETLAYHYSRSENADKAVLYLERAGAHALSLHANETAEAAYRELVERLLALDRQREAAAAQERLGSVLAVLARYDEALAVLDRTAQAYEGEGDFEAVGRTVAQLGRVHVVRGTPGEGIERVRAALRRLGAEQRPAARAALLTALGSLYWVTGRHVEQLPVCEEAVQRAEEAGAHETLVEARVWYGHALLALNRDTEGVRELEAVLPLAEQIGDLASASRALNGIAAVHGERGEFDAELPALERALALAERHGDPTRLAYMLYRRGRHALLCGDWRAARTFLERAVGLVRQFDASWASAYALYGLGELYLLLGDEAEATRHLDECRARAMSTGDQRALQALESVLIETDLERGRAPQARARLEALLDRIGCAEQSSGSLLPLVAWVHLESGNTAGAAECARAGIRDAELQRNRLTLIDALRVSGMVAAAERRWNEAEDAFEQATALAHAMPNPYAEGRSLWWRGVALHQKGELESARHTWETALTTFNDLGAAPDAQRVQRALQGQGPIMSPMWTASSPLGTMGEPSHEPDAGNALVPPERGLAPAHSVRVGQRP